MRGNLLALLLAISAPAVCPAAGEAPAPRPQQDRCFCIQFTGQALPPYYLGRLTLPGCDKLKYKDKGGGPFKSGLLSCPSLQLCLQLASDASPKLKALEEKTATALKKRAACCPKGAACDAKCAADWDGILKILDRETGKLRAEHEPAIAACLEKNRLRERNPSFVIRNGLRVGSESAD